MDFKKKNLFTKTLHYRTVKKKYSNIFHAYKNMFRSTKLEPLIFLRKFIIGFYEI